MNNQNNSIQNFFLYKLEIKYLFCNVYHFAKYQINFFFYFFPIVIAYKL